MDLPIIYRSKIGGLQPMPGDPKDNGVAAMLDDRSFCFVIQHGRHAIVFLDHQGLVANHQFHVPFIVYFVDRITVHFL